MAGPVAHTGLNKYVTKTVIRKPQVKRVNGKRVHRIRGNIKKDLREIVLVRHEFY